MNIFNNLQKIAHQGVIHCLPNELFSTEPVSGGAIQARNLVWITIAQLCLEKIMEQVMESVPRFCCIDLDYEESIRVQFLQQGTGVIAACQKVTKLRVEARQNRRLKQEFLSVGRLLLKN